LTHKQAVSALYASHYADIVCYCRGLLGDQSAAEDAAQEVFAAILDGATPREDAHLLAFARGIARNMCARIKRRRCQDEHLRVAPGLDATTENPAQTMVAAERAEEVRLAVEFLPARQAAAITLHHLRELSVKETALYMGISEATVKTHLVRGMRKLRAQYGVAPVSSSRRYLVDEGGEP
jgi:RNA polymerase sigma-70 factor (ECF subfamily)